MSIGGSKWQIELYREREISAVVICKPVSLCQARQFEKLTGRMLSDINRKFSESHQEAFELLDRDAFAAQSHYEAISNLIESQAGNYGTVLRKVGENAQAVLTVSFILQKPLERKGSVQHEIGQNRWPS